MSELEQTAGDTRSKWVSPRSDDVARTQSQPLLHDADPTGLKKHNAAWYAIVFGQTAQPGRSSCLIMHVPARADSGREAGGVERPLREQAAGSGGRCLLAASLAVRGNRILHVNAYHR
jgi:hypothetical protein